MTTINNVTNKIRFIGIFIQVLKSVIKLIDYSWKETIIQKNKNIIKKAEILCQIQWLSPFLLRPKK